MQTSADPLGMRAFIRPKTHAGPPLHGGTPAALVTLDNLEPIAGPSWRRRLIRMSALSTFDGTLRAYHGDHG
jgi:hypothetical protein